MSTMTNPTWVQSAFRGRSGDTVVLNDNTTWAANLNTNWSQQVDTTFRVRIEVEETATATQNNTLSPQLQYNLNGAGWNSVTTSSLVVRAVASGQFNEGNATTNILASSARGFVASTGSEDGLAGNATLSNQHTEAEFSIQLRSADVSNNDSIQLRLSNAGTALNTYSQTPTVTAIAPITVTPPTLSLTTTRFAPTVTASDHKTVTPTTASLTLTTFAPTVTVAAPNITVTPGVASLTTSRFAPTVSVSDNQTVTPTTASLTTTRFAPSVTTTQHQTVIPGVIALSITPFAPVVTATGAQPPAATGGWALSRTSRVSSRKATEYFEYFEARRKEIVARQRKFAALDKKIEQAEAENRELEQDEIAAAERLRLLKAMAAAQPADAALEDAKRVQERAAQMLQALRNRQRAVEARSRAYRAQQEAERKRIAKLLQAIRQKSSALGDEIETHRARQAQTKSALLLLLND